MNSKRIKYMDGLRGVAILSVVFFHAFSRWGEEETFDQSALLKDFFEYGWLGVQLFFAVSGYVIYMSILNSNNALMFSLSRYLRLAPAMLIASALIYLTAQYIPERPWGVLNIVDLLPSLTFIDPIILELVLGMKIKSLDTVFWSLYVEVKFYITVAILFFVFKDRKLYGLSMLYAIWWILEILTNLFNVTNPVVDNALYVIKLADIEYYGWFLLGIFAYQYQAENNTRNLIVLFTMAFIAILSLWDFNFKPMLATTITACLFLIPIFSSYIRRILSTKLILFFGYISYPLYLIHQNLVTGLAIKLHGYYPDLPAYFYPLPFIGAVILCAYFIARLEPFGKKALRSLFPNEIFGYKLQRQPI